MSVKFIGARKKLDAIDFGRIGELIGVGEDEVHAIVDVEAAGSGFDSRGRVKALFEPHVFYKILKGEKRAQAVAMGLAYPRWGSKPYPRDSYNRILQAMTIDVEAACRATSWGLGQIMGDNYRYCGYPSAVAMVEDFADDEENQLRAMINFIKSRKLDRHLRNHDWAKFAAGYNGPGFRKNAYDRKLAERFRIWTSRRDVGGVDVSFEEPTSEPVNFEPQTDDTLEPQTDESQTEAGEPVSFEEGEEKPGFFKRMGQRLGFFKSRTIRGATTVTVGVMGQAAEGADMLAPIADYSGAIKTAFVVLTILGVIWVVVARVNDHKSGKNDWNDR